MAETGAQKDRPDLVNKLLSWSRPGAEVPVESVDGASCCASSSVVAAPAAVKAASSAPPLLDNEADLKEIVLDTVAAERAGPALAMSAQRRPIGPPALSSPCLPDDGANSANSAHAAAAESAGPALAVSTQRRRIRPLALSPPRLPDDDVHDTNSVDTVAAEDVVRWPL